MPQKKLKKQEQQTCDLNQLSESWNMQIYLYVHNCSFKQCYPFGTGIIFF